MSLKKRISILFEILDQISRDNEEARNGIENSIAIFAKNRAFLLNRYFIFCFFDAAVIFNCMESLTVQRTGCYRFKMGENIQIFT